MGIKYEFTEDEVNYMLGALNKQQICGAVAANTLLYMVNKLQKPFKQSKNAEIQQSQTEKKVIPKKEKEKENAKNR